MIEYLEQLKKYVPDPATIKQNKDDSVLNDIELFAWIEKTVRRISNLLENSKGDSVHFNYLNVRDGGQNQRILNRYYDHIVYVFSEKYSVEVVSENIIHRDEIVVTNKKLIISFK